MKTFGLIITLVLGITGASAFAAEYRDDNRTTYRSERHSDSRLGYQIERMNRMLNHVQGEVRRYGAGWRTRREVAGIANEVSRINWRYRHNQDHWRLAREVERVRAELRNIEVRLHVRSGEFFRWD